MCQLCNNSYSKIKLQEVTRWQMINRGKAESPERFAKSKKYRPSDFKNVDFEKLFTDNEFVWKTTETGTSTYDIIIAFEGAFDQLQLNLKSWRGKNRYKRINPSHCIEALSQALDTEDLFVFCSCPDFKYRFRYWASQADCVYGEPETRAPKVRNVRNNKGYVCKHLLAVLYGKRWVTAAGQQWWRFIQANPDLAEYYIWNKKLDDEIDNEINEE